ncbi:MAG: four-helix bundle copper-binding protein [Gemmataceae bacterium]|nr:four-helix bundle copper-binding protein [Gemmataceae bacterium]
MNRRKALGALGATAIGLTALPTGLVRAEQGADAQHENMMKCAKMCADCQISCDMCFHHCAELLTKGTKEHAKTMHLCIDCAECCSTASRLVARSSPLAAAACECCAKCNDECAAACEKFKDDKHMAACAKSCRDCAKSCREMIKHLAH